jgi:hypothetical protein
MGTTAGRVGRGVERALGAGVVLAILAVLNGCRIDAGGLAVSAPGGGEVPADAGMRRLWSPGEVGGSPPRSGGSGSNAGERGTQPHIDTLADAAPETNVDPVAAADSGADSGGDSRAGDDPGPAPVLSRDLLLWFSFDDRATSGIGPDRSGHGHEGVLRGLSPGSAWVAAAFGGALDLAANGQRGSVIVPTSRYLEGIVNELSVAAWIRLPPQQDPGVILSRQAGAGGLALYRLEVKERRLKLQVRADASGARPLELVSDRPVPTEQWAHVAMVLDHGMASLFLDGARVAMAPWSGQTIRSGEPLTIGASPPRPGDASPTTDHLPAQLDEILVYRRGLIDAEVTALASGSLP